MGRGQIDTASVYAHGEVDALYMQSLPVQGELTTGSLSGITDSGAAATTMATGRKTLNTRIGTDEHGASLETVIELAKARGLATGVVTTSYLPHATPGSFTAHRLSRHDPVGIADDQALVVQPDLMMGGGAAFYLPAGPDSERDDEGLIEPLQDAGYSIITTAQELEDGPSLPVVGLFSSEHMTYVADRAADTTEPTLRDMTMAAIDLLDDDPEGFLLVVEGARIDMASHGNDILRTMTETVAFDEAIEAVGEWSTQRDDATVLVTADHECGGLTPVGTAEAGEIPDVTWRWGVHTNARVDVFGLGPGSEVFESEIRDHAWVHSVLVSRITGEPLQEPAVELVPDGRLTDLRHVAAEQTWESNFGVGHNQLEALRLDASPAGLAIGIEGVFKADRNALLVLIDVDFGAQTGFDGLQGHLMDYDGRVDAILSSADLTASSVPGFGADAAITVWGATEMHREVLDEDAGLRGLVAPLGEPDNLAWLPTSINFGESVRVPTGVTGEVSPDEGWETLVPWPALFPALDGDVPPGATVGVVAVLVDDDGTGFSNQALPAFPPEADLDGSSVGLPGVVEFTVDMDGDGVADGDASPVVRYP